MNILSINKLALDLVALAPEFHRLHPALERPTEAAFDQALQATFKAVQHHAAHGAHRILAVA